MKILTLFLWALIDAYRTVPRKPATARGFKKQTEEKYEIFRTVENKLPNHTTTMYKLITVQKMEQSKCHLDPMVLPEIMITTLSSHGSVCVTNQHLALSFSSFI